MLPANFSHSQTSCLCCSYKCIKTCYHDTCEKRRNEEENEASSSGEIATSSASKYYVPPGPYDKQEEYIKKSRKEMRSNYWHDYATKSGAESSREKITYGMKVKHTGCYAPQCKGASTSKETSNTSRGVTWR